MNISVVQDFVNIADTEGGGYAISDSFIKSYNVLERHCNIAVSVSGGKDSDVVVDLVSKLDTEKKVKYVWFDTGLEYQATKDHIKYLEERYGIVIAKEGAIKSIPTACKEYGQPFLSKFVSGTLYSLQKSGFKFEDRSFSDLREEYPKIKSGLKWWCNMYQPYNSQYNIRRNKWLKEFMILNPPMFKISKNVVIMQRKRYPHIILRNTI